MSLLTASTVTRLLLVASGAAATVAALVQRYPVGIVYHGAERAAQTTAEGMHAVAIECLASLTAAEETADEGAAQRAAIAAAKEAIAAHSGEAIVLCADPRTLSGMLCYGLGVPISAARRFRIERAAITVIEVDAAGRWALVRLNEWRPPADS